MFHPSSPFRDENTHWISAKKKYPHNMYDKSMHYNYNVYIKLRKSMEDKLS